MKLKKLSNLSTKNPAFKVFALVAIVLGHFSGFAAETRIDGVQPIIEAVNAGQRIQVRCSNHFANFTMEIFKDEPTPDIRDRFQPKNPLDNIFMKYTLEDKTTGDSHSGYGDQDGDLAFDQLVFLPAVGDNTFQTLTLRPGRLRLAESLGYHVQGIVSRTPGRGRGAGSGSDSVSVSGFAVENCFQKTL